ncbi:MAG: NAD(P)-dependent oxidoreductase [Methanobrevibacter sp.]|uniref:NAD(P)-dependent oxidoreductase n=1 Tax=Methanobrevibacter sp. TaxID=66852 RepID=UPI0026DF4123|nr:NAD(P)-dependent oxidoreductase [Methanobrevibacter sp.]MDO5848379.1 NAD(P)-dependent oxidoreductase [Methanobrevibacter sp.]
MKIGFIGFGEVNRKLAEILKNETLLTSKEGRSRNTIFNIDKSDAEVLDNFEQVAINSDILISANSPSNALKTAEKYGRLCDGIYLDLNNISPKTVGEIKKVTNNFVDSSIIGGINNDFRIYLSGEKSRQLEFLSNYLPIEIISDNIGDASKLKLLRSIYTKSVSAALIETMEIAEKLNLEEELLDTISLSEGENFKKLAISRIKNTKNNPKRKEEEMLEILDYFKGHSMEMSEATLKKLSNL